MNKRIISKNLWFYLITTSFYILSSLIVNTDVFAGGIEFDENTALIIIEMQNDYFPGGEYPLENSTEAVITAVKNLNSSPVLYDSILYFESEDGYLYAMAIFEYIKKPFSDIRLSGNAENFSTRNKNDPEIEATINISNYSYLTDSIYIRFGNIMI